MNEETLNHIRAFQAGNKEAAQALVVENSGLIWSVVRRFFGRGVDSDDLYQLGCVGFLKAIQGFNEEYGTQFSTYAVPKISGEIRRFLRDDGTIKVSRSIKENAMHIKAVRSRLEQELGRDPTVSELAEATGFDPEEIATAETATQATESLQKETGEESFTLESVLGDWGQEERVIEHLALAEAVKKLPDREQMIISLRYFHGLTQDRTAKVMGVTQVQVSRLERKAVNVLKTLMAV